MDLITCSVLDQICSRGKIGLPLASLLIKLHTYLLSFIIINSYCNHLHKSISTLPIFNTKLHISCLLICEKKKKKKRWRLLVQPYKVPWPQCIYSSQLTMLSFWKPQTHIHTQTQKWQEICTWVAALLHNKLNTSPTSTFFWTVSMYDLGKIACLLALQPKRCFILWISNLC